jgi:enterochelin esterase-like enzyme
VRRVLLLALLVALAGCGGNDGGSSKPFELRSRAVGATLSHRVLIPAGVSDKPPLLVLLHGRGGGPKGMVSDELEDALDDAGDRAPIVLLPDGGESSYWHNRDDGAWTRMVMREVIPAAIEKYGADPDRVAIGGISMGGFGALHLAAAFPGRFCAVGAHSPAIFADAASTAAGAFDDAEDFERHDLLARARQIPAGAWVDVGDDDPFAPAVRQLVDRMRSPRFHPWPGKHEGAYWRSHMHDYIDFYVRSLARCRRR